MQKNLSFAILLIPFMAHAQWSTNGTSIYYNAGKVGIGTSSPTTLLHLSASSGYIVVNHTSADPGNSTVYDYETGKNVYWGESADGGYYIFRGRNVYVQEGSLGVGIVPSYKLHVNGRAAASTFRLSENADNILESSDNGNFYHMIATHRGWDPHAVYVAGCNAGNASVSGYSTVVTQRVNIGNPNFNDKYLTVNFMNGGVGIGTSSTGDANYRLFVEKGIRTRKITVDQATWPDYVFGKGFTLRPLSELETFIRKNNHLPGLPSAAEVKADGINLGDNQALLLKKIEELTLYMIRQDKELKALKKEVKALRGQKTK